MTAVAAREALRFLNGATGSGDLHAVAPTDTPDTTWAPVDLAPILAGEQVDDPPTILARTDGTRLFYRGRLHNVQGEPEACKGWLILAAAAELLEVGEAVVYLDFEDDAASVVGRLRSLGIEPDRIANSFRYVRPDEPLGAEGGPGQTHLRAALASQPSLVVIDGVTEAMTLHGLELADNSDVARWLTLLPRPLTTTGAAVVQVDHVIKEREGRKRYAIGAQHKLAGVHAAYALDVVEPFGRGRNGLVKVTVTKDRPGFVRQHADGEQRIALMRLASIADTGAVTVTLDPPDSTDDAGRFRPTVLMGRISRAVEEQPGLTAREIRALRGKSDALEHACRLLVAESYLRVERDGAAHRHYSVRPYSEDGDA